MSWITLKDKPDKGEIARFGSLKVFRFVTTGLHYAREKAKWVLFEELMYMMTLWSNGDCDVDQRSLRIAWGHEGDDVKEIGISAIADCRKSGLEPFLADEHNTCLLTEFLSARREMVLCVSHKVKIKPSPGSVRHVRSGEEVLRRIINIVDIAAKVCVVFTEQTIVRFSPLPFLGAHTGSLKCIYAVALLLRRVVETFMHAYTVDGAFLLPDEEDPPLLQCHGISFETLLPAASIRKRLLSSRCLRMSAEEFDKLNADGTSGGVEGKADDEGDEDDGDIVLSNTDGVMLL